MWDKSVRLILWCCTSQNVDLGHYILHFIGYYVGSLCYELSVRGFYLFILHLIMSLCYVYCFSNVLHDPTAETFFLNLWGTHIMETCSWLKHIHPVQLKEYKCTVGLEMHNCKLFFFFFFLNHNLACCLKKRPVDCFDRKGCPIPPSTLSVHNLPTLGSVRANTVCTQCTMINPQIAHSGGITP